jgi:hypothetical protein
VWRSLRYDGPSRLQTLTILLRCVSRVVFFLLREFFSLIYSRVIAYHIFCYSAPTLTCLFSVWFSHLPDIVSQLLELVPGAFCRRTVKAMHSAHAAAGNSRSDWLSSSCRYLDRIISRRWIGVRGVVESVGYAGVFGRRAVKTIHQLYHHTTSHVFSCGLIDRVPHCLYCLLLFPFIYLSIVWPAFVHFENNIPSL